MWTNVFRIGGLQQVSWFQYLPSESQCSTLTEKSANIEEQKDTATLLVLSAHIRLQNRDFLSTWTNSFIGPWDPSQGIHNPDEKIKLWLFLPGRQSSINATAQTAVSGLKVVASGLWSAPGDSEEVAVAFSQALRNRIERAFNFRGLSYMRFGDVFVKCRSFGKNDIQFRKPLSTCEFIFSASEEAIFVHVLVSSKRVRALSSNDMEGVLRSNFHSNRADEKLTVFVAPHGMRGKLTGCCPSDLASQLYQRKMKASNDFSEVTLPFHFSQASYGKIRGQTCYAEVSLGCLAGRVGKAGQLSSNVNKSGIKQDEIDIPSSEIPVKDERKQGCEDYVQLVERTLIYPAEAVLVPMVPIVPARTCLRRCWLKDWAGTSWLENGPLADMSCTSSSISGFTKLLKSVWITEEENLQWMRCSEDDKVSNHFGEELLTPCGAFKLIICNGLDRWKGSGNFTCNTYNGASVVDYVICSQSFIEKIGEVKIGKHNWDLKSDHNPIYMKVSWVEERQHKRKTQCSRQSLPRGKIFLTQENCTIFKTMLERLIQKEKTGFQSFTSHELTNIMQREVEKCKRAKNRKSESNCFPVNAWFDEECKMARRTLKKTGKEKMNVKLYKQILKRKEDEFMQRRREELIYLGKNNPKLFW